MKDFMSLAEERYSVRKFKDTIPEEEKTELILKAAMLAPTACNNQPQKIYVVKDPDRIARLTEICPCIYGAPLVFVIAYDKDRAAKGKVRPGYDFGETDAAIVTTHMMLEAAELGLGTCWVGWFVDAEVREALGLPENVSVCDLLPTGYAADDSVPSESHTKSRAMYDVVTVI